MKKSIAAGICLGAFAIAGITAIGSGGIKQLAWENSIEKNVQGKADKIEAEIKYTAADERRYDRIAEYIGYDTFEKFKLLHDTALFMEANCVTKEQFDLVEEMILDGCDVRTVLDIYTFYMTTGENADIVKKIYDIVWDGEEIKNRDVVFEGAFNYLTGNKCGVLTREDIEAYLEEGLTEEDILDANLLSRRGVLKVDEILDRMAEGETMESIVEVVAGSKITAAEKADDNTALINAVNRKKLYGKSAGAKAETEEDAEEKAKDAVNKIFKSKGYWKAKESENKDTIVKMAKERGIDEKDVEKLMDSGYSELDIINSLGEEKCSRESFEEPVRAEAER